MHISIHKLFTAQSNYDRAFRFNRAQQRLVNRGDAMAEQRRFVRQDCDEKCILHQTELHYFATVKNISYGGAFVEFSYPQPDLHVGDHCDISIDGEIHRDHCCRVVRIDNHDVAVMFTDMHDV